MAIQRRREVERFSDLGEMLRVEASRIVESATDAIARRGRAPIHQT